MLTIKTSTKHFGGQMPASFLSAIQTLRSVDSVNGALVFPNLNDRVRENERINGMIDTINGNEAYYDGTIVGNYTTTINDTGEKAFQRAIMLMQNGIHDYSFLDIELPVFNSQITGTRRVDLVAYHINNDKYVLFELKYAPIPGINAIGDRPVLAVLEVLLYRVLALRHINSLRSLGIVHGNRNNFWNNITNENLKMAVAANANYWDTWTNNNTYWAEFITWLEAAKLIDKIEFIRTSNVNFQEQRLENGNGPYTPYWPEDGLWETIAMRRGL